MRMIRFFKRIVLIIGTMALPIIVNGQIPAGYYDSAQGLTGSELKNALYHIVSDHTKYPYTSSSTDVWDILKESDEDPENSDNVILIYTGRSQAKTENSGESSTTGSNRWNREHIWSKSHGFPDEIDTAYTDCHHLRPADESVNSSRSELDFDNGGNQHVEATDCYYDSDSWEPRDAVKGDVARMMFYMVVRYDPGYHTDNSLYDLELVDTVGTDTYQPTFGKLSTLLQWHIQDPVDAFEQNRNEVVYDFQGNRNPFIDHPEWVDQIFSSQLGSNTQVGFTRNSISVNEDAGSIFLEVAIFNPDTTMDTHCGIYLTGGTGDSSDLGGFFNYALTFPAGGNTIAQVEIPITDDDIVEDLETFVFSILNVTGGDSAIVNGDDNFVLTINPSDHVSAVEGLIISEVMDGNRSGGQPKFLEITNVTNSTMSIGGFQIWRGSNGGDPGQVVDIPTGTEILAHASWVIANSSAGMVGAGYTAPDQETSAINGNGNDVYQLRSEAGHYIDAFGLAGTSTPWYENSYAQRIPSVLNGTAIYSSDEWVINTLGADTPMNGSPGTPGTHISDPWVSVVNHYHPEIPELIRTYPNPFNAGTMISIWMKHAGFLKVEVFDIQGRQVLTISEGHFPSGTYDFHWSGTDALGRELPSGVYLLQIQTNTSTDVQRISILR